jgi:multiple sugar transport system permease protein
MANIPVAEKNKLNNIAFSTMQSKKMEEIITAYVFLAPAIIIFLVFLIIPIFFALFVSITDWNGISPLTQRAAASFGIVEFTNQTESEIIIPTGTIINSIGDSPISYETTEDIVLPAGIDSVVEASVKASDDSLGAESNIRANVVSEIRDAELAEQVIANNPLPIARGLNDAYNLIGMQNYNDLLFERGLAQRDFFLSLKNTVYFVLGVVPTQTILALLLAVIVNQKWLRFRGAFRTAFYFPSVTSSVVISIIFMWMFTRGGIVNTALEWIIPNFEAVTWLDNANGVIHNILGGFGIIKDNVGDWANNRIAGITVWDWMSGPSVTMLTIMILNTWTTIGTMMIIYLAALQNIPSQVYEAAQIDGANAWQTFTRITVPLLAPTTFFIVTLGLIGTFQVFDQIFVISSGLAGATALILFMIISVFTLLQRFITRERLA